MASDPDAAPAIHLKSRTEHGDISNNGDMRVLTLLFILVLLTYTATPNLLALEQASADPSTLIGADQFARWDKVHARTSFGLLQDDSANLLTPVKKAVPKTIAATPEAQSLDGKNISIDGYMIPIDLDGKGSPCSFSRRISKPAVSELSAN